MAKRSIRNGTTSNILRVFLPDNTSTSGAGKTGLTFSSSGLIISTIADTESSATTYTQAASNIETITTNGTFAAPTSSKCRFKEVDATNHPGLYEVQIADARFAVSNAKTLFVTISGAGVAPTTCEIQQDDLPSNIRSINSDTTAPVNLALAYNGTGYIDGTAQAGAAGSITLAAGSSSTTDFYAGYLILPVGGTGGGQSPRLCVGYNGTTKVASVRPNWAVTPDNTTTYVFSPAADWFRAVLAESEGSITIQQALSVILAACSGEWTAAGTFKTPNGVGTRIAGTAAGSAPFRSAITLTPSS